MSSFASSSSSSSSSSTTPVKVLTYNMFLRPPIVRNNESDFKEVRLDAFIDMLKDKEYDVLILQEIFCRITDRQHRLIEAAKTHGYLYHTVATEAAWTWHETLFPITGCATRPKLVDAGLLILSRYPIVAADAHMFTHGNQIDAWAAKQVIHAKIRLSHNNFCHVFNTHLQSNYSDNTPVQNALNNLARQLQILEMAAFIERVTKGSRDPILIGGDLNINAKAVAPINIWSHASYTEYAAAKNLKTDTNISEYEYMMLVLRSVCPSLRDVLLHDKGEHLVTYADYYICKETGLKLPRESVLTDKSDLCIGARLDYLLFSPSSTSSISLDGGSADVQTFPCQIATKSGHVVTQLSDHYGISACLRVSRPLLHRRPLQRRESSLLLMVLSCATNTNSTEKGNIISRVALTCVQKFFFGLFVFGVFVAEILHLI
eukprot:TRINITY_DN11167_c0_g1_i1.p1 TRINITY_DN11167_c0_g1~~TRINITY_DN11167_c0_g1_i1.p1  ORF type:complete len:431 (-),score=87.81 TRINITY_DN11167_c0_g1_i1:43-1335(-)